METLIDEILTKITPAESLRWVKHTVWRLKNETDQILQERGQVSKNEGGGSK